MAGRTLRKQSMKILVAACLLFISELSIAQSQTFTVSGKIKGLDSKKIDVLIRDENAKGGSRRDSIAVIDGSFSYTTTVNDITMLSFSPGVERVVKRAGKGYFPVKSSLLQFFAFPGANVKFSGEISDFVDAYPSGDPINNDFAKLNRSVYPLMNKGVNLNVKIANGLITDSIKVRQAKDSIKMLDEQVVSIKKEFISKNPSSVAAIWLLSDMMVRSQLTNEEAAALFAKMNKEKLVGVPFYAEVAKRVDAISTTSIGKQVPDISSLNTFDGKRFELSSLKGKYVVIDFWGTWCMPCVAGMPTMKQYLDKYKDKMEIVGVAQESDNGQNWKKLLTSKPEFVWHHVLSRQNEDYILKFGVAGFPIKIIVDRQGKFVGRFVGEDEAIYKKLDELLK